jgi:hypothetical protein
MTTTHAPTRLTPTGPIALVDGSWHSVNLYKGQIDDIRYKLSPAECAAAGVLWCSVGYCELDSVEVICEHEGQRYYSKTLVSPLNARTVCAQFAERPFDASEWHKA